MNQKFINGLFESVVEEFLLEKYEKAAPVMILKAMHSKAARIAKYRQELASGTLSPQKAAHRLKRINDLEKEHHALNDLHRSRLSYTQKSAKDRHVGYTNTQPHKHADLEAKGRLPHPTYNPGLAKAASHFAHTNDGVTVIPRQKRGRKSKKRSVSPTYHDSNLAYMGLEPAKQLKK